MKKFLCSAKTYGPLRNNPFHMFAIQQTMSIYESNSLCTWIPKNACSTLRLSVAMANGCIADVSQANWIHHNNPTFAPSLRDAALAGYVFVVLRCPYRRLASVFLEKFVEKKMDAWQFREASGYDFELSDLTFRQFVNRLTRTGVSNCNIHWRLQSRFLLFDEYDDYFSVENFSDAAQVLKDKIGLDVIDARLVTKHGTDQYSRQSDGFFGDTCAFDLSVMKREGAVPDYSAMFDESIIQSVKKMYEEDINLYVDKTGLETLF